MNWQSVVCKILSGRWLATIAIVGTYSFMACNNMIEKDFVKEITLLVLFGYFTKIRNDQK